MSRQFFWTTLWFYFTSSSSKITFLQKNSPRKSTFSAHFSWLYWQKIRKKTNFHFNLRPSCSYKTNQLHNLTFSIKNWKGGRRRLTSLTARSSIFIYRSVRMITGFWLLYVIPKKLEISYNTIFKTANKERYRSKRCKSKSLMSWRLFQIKSRKIPWKKINHRKLSSQIMNKKFLRIKTQKSIVIYSETICQILPAKSKVKNLIKLLKSLVQTKILKTL